MLYVHTYVCTYYSKQFHYKLFTGYVDFDSYIGLDLKFVINDVSKVSLLLNARLQMKSNRDKSIIPDNEMGPKSHLINNRCDYRTFYLKEYTLIAEQIILSSNTIMLIVL